MGRELSSVAPDGLDRWDWSGKVDTRYDVKSCPNLYSNVSAARLNATTQSCHHVRSCLVYRSLSTA